MKSKNLSQVDILNPPLLAKRSCLIAILLCTISLSQTIAAQSGHELRLFPLEEGIQMPFTTTPVKVGVLSMGDGRIANYSLPLESEGIFFAASVMLTPSLKSRSPQSILEAYLESASEGAGARTLSQSATSIDGRPARESISRIQQFGMEARIYNIAIYDDGKVHNWSVQEIVELSEGKGEALFRENMRRISFP